VHKGCTYPYFRRSTAPLQAPEPPARSDLAPGSARCPAEGKESAPPRPGFPPGYERRGIEGWAAISYDVAPWGEAGNIRVLASEPSAAFGDIAQQVVRSVRSSASEIGKTGCTRLVRFKLPLRGRDTAEDQN
jgi:TonB family protein